MKKLICLFVLTALFSCEKDDTNTNNQQAKQEKFFKLIEGRYELQAATTDTPIDLDGDGTPHSDLYKEVVYCNLSPLLNSFICFFQHTPPGNGFVSSQIPKYANNNISYDIPTSEYALPPNVDPMSCIRSKRLSHYFKINAETQEVMLALRDHYNSYVARFHTEFLDIRWEDGVAYFKFRKRYRLPDGGTKWVILHLKYVKVSDAA